MQIRRVNREFRAKRIARQHRLLSSASVAYTRVATAPASAAPVMPKVHEHGFEICTECAVGSAYGSNQPQPDNPGDHAPVCIDSYRSEFSEFGEWGLSNG